MRDDEWSMARDGLAAAVVSLGYPEEFGGLLAKELGSPKAIERMTSWLYGMDWVFINLNSMICAPGMPGIKVCSTIREHAITAEEFKVIWGIFTQYEELKPLEMPPEKAAVKLILQNRHGTITTDENVTKAAIQV